MNRIHAIRVAVVGGALALVAALSLLAGCGEDAPPRSFAVTGEEAISDQLREFTVETPSLETETKVRVLLPEGYESSGETYPVLYLLHGAGADAGFWTDADVASLVRGLPLIVVMPDGETGFYSDWFNDGEGGPPRWETYHTQELVPWVDSEFRTRDDRAGRGVAGVSMGGLGALLYAAHHPDLFGFAASLSGSVLVEPGPMAKLLAATGRDPALLGPIWGSYPEEADNWAEHNPVELAEGLDGVELVLSTGNGKAPGSPVPADRVESQTHAMNVALHRRLQQLGIEHVWDDYGPGAHDVPDWRDALARALPRLLDAPAAEAAAASPEGVGQ